LAWYKLNILGDSMNKLATAIAAFALIGTSAFAADMPVKAPPVAPAPVYNWTGWYAGVNLGASFGHVKTDFNVAPAFVNGVGLTPDLTGSDISHPSGFIGGGQVGYNWQYSPLIVVGLEADIQGALERETNKWGQPFDFDNLINANSTGAVATTYTTQIDWFGTVRGRIGYLWGDGAVLTYLTGGLAYGEVKINGISTVSGIGRCGCPTDTGGAQSPFRVSGAFGHSQINTGWVVGFGTEGKLLIPGWTYKIESLYMDLGTLDTTGVTSGVIVANVAPSPRAATGVVTTHSHFTDGILRLGLNYQFH
jgi:outer membrane immunogenic protein